eukprot:TRINITY_DN5041_c0_g2_i1.p1 TRINITY_DN5041_c0_g2~~TRINITY_DN5041_c0_g2_i1.p1  ORF type:complete len:389 (+),score=109.10 TRINITY_DN5041_c0_g2_i1:53-1168(+)
MSPARMALPRRGLEEFRDRSEDVVGRPWKASELRLKSFDDLHKLWYVLLKERNMLLSVRHECIKRSQEMPNPERVYMVKLSMARLKTVLGERSIEYRKIQDDIEKKLEVDGEKRREFEHLETEKELFKLRQTRTAVEDPQKLREIQKKIHALRVRVRDIRKVQRNRARGGFKHAKKDAQPPQTDYEVPKNFREESLAKTRYVLKKYDLSVVNNVSTYDPKLKMNIRFDIDRAAKLRLEETPQFEKEKKRRDPFAHTFVQRDQKKMEAVKKARKDRVLKMAAKRKYRQAKLKARIKEAQVGPSESDIVQRQMALLDRQLLKRRQLAAQKEQEDRIAAENSANRKQYGRHWRAIMQREEREAKKLAAKSKSSS